MTELACVYDAAAPVPRTPCDIITPPGADKGKDGKQQPRARPLQGNG